MNMTLCRYLGRLLLGCFALLAAPWAAAVTCSEIFPQDMKENGVVLDLGFLSDKDLKPFPSKTQSLQSSGDLFFNGGSLGNGQVLSVQTGPGVTTRIFVQGDLTLEPHSSLNPLGVPENLILIVNGTLTIKADQQTPDTINALIYAVGNVSLGNGINVKGAITSQGKIDSHNKSSVEYDSDAVAKADFGDFLCNGGNVPRVDHYRLSYTSQALTCQPHQITVSACMDDSCSSTYDGPSSVTLFPSSGWSGGNTISFTGSTTISLSVRSPEEVTLGIGSASPAASKGLQCSTGGCKVAFLDSGFVIRGLSPMIAGKPQLASIQAVRKSDDSPACVPAFSGGIRTLQVSASYVDPAGPSGTARTLRVGTTNLLPGGPAQDVSLTFDAAASAPLPVTYLDAGVVRLTATFTGTDSSGPDGQSEAGLQMSRSADFVSRPFGLCLETDLAHDPVLRFAGAAGGETLQSAGDAFDVRIRAVAWTAADENDPDATAPRQPRICANPTTPNYQQLKIPLTHAVLEPSSGEPGSLAIGGYEQQRGESTLLAGQKIDEVGVFQLTASPPVYFGQSMTHAVSQSGRVGRFVPAWLEVDSDLSQEPACREPSFTYQGQPTRLSGGLRIKGFNRSENPTLNYQGEFWRVGDVQAYGFYRSNSAPYKNESSHVTRRPAIMPEPQSGKIQFGDHYQYPRQAMPSVVDEPFELKWIIWDLHDADGVYFSNRQGEKSTWGTKTEGIQVAGLIDNSLFRLGQLRSENLIVPLGKNGRAPISLEHWSGTSWQAATDDNCTLLVAPTDSPEQLTFPDPGITAATVDAADWNQSDLPITATAPEVPQGNVLLRHLVRSQGANATWLCRERSEASVPLGGVCSYSNGGNAETRSLITFGIYKGPKPLIFRREVYR